MLSYSLIAQPWVLATLVFNIGFIYILSALAYRRFLHPLSKIPGPPLASVTYLYQTYYNTVGGKQFYAQIEKLHEIYGMPD
jgi:hypothetical protein